MDWGTYAFERMPFGLCNALGTFQQIMMDIFHDFLRHFLEVFIDDFAVFSQRKDHIEHLRLTLDKCKEAYLKLNPAKYFIGMDSGILLGHRVSVQGISVDLEKVTTIFALKALMTVKEVRGFPRNGWILQEICGGLCKDCLTTDQTLEKGYNLPLVISSTKGF